jgi:outer membrane receptor protein involved in Fe transport
MMAERQNNLLALRALLLSAATAPGLLVGAPAIAQQAPAQTNSASAVEEIIVTGSRIRRPNVDSAVPVTSIGSEEIFSTGNTSVGDLLNDLPALRSTLSTANSTRFIGTAGLNQLDLRGLGTSRTLVLVNGRRHVGATEGDNDVDTNSIPSDLVERIDVVTGGSSAVYGSDAIAGVVNFILKDDFEGSEVRAQYGVSKYGDADTYFISAVTGINFDDNKGNVAFALETARQRELLFPDRARFASRSGFVITDSPAGETNGTDGIPDRTFFPGGLRSVTISDGGSVIPGCAAALTGTARQLRCLPGGNIARVFRFQPDGTIAEADYGQRDFRPNANTTLGGDGSTLRNYGQLIPETDRIALNLIGKYEVSDAFIPFIEAKYVQNNVLQESSPSFAQGALILSLDNPFLTQQARDFLNARLPGTSPSRTFSLNRNNVDLGIRGEDTRRETYRFVTGVRGDFNDDWNYELSLNYGRYQKRSIANANQQVQRFEFANDPVRDSTGKIVCRVTIDPAARQAIDPALEKYLAADVANCVPFNPFGFGAPSAESIAYINANTLDRGNQDQFVASGFFGGDSSDWFELPGGPVRFAAGAEYRRQTSYDAFEELVRDGGTFLNAIPIFDPPAFEVKEAFGEVDIPLIKDLPFIQELSLQGAGRVADYKGATGTVFAWNAGSTWTPNDWIRFRGNYSVAVRAPVQSELFSANTQNFASLSDPCDVNFRSSGTANRPVNCLAAGIPADFVNQLARQQTTEIVSGGNPGLTEEKSRSTTLGFVFTPQAILDGLTLSVDYYRINIKDVIAAVSVQQLLNLCYDSESLDNAFCPLVKRNPSGTRDPRTGDDTSFYFVQGEILQSSLNFASRIAKGIDFDVNYTTEIGDYGTLDLSAVGTYVIDRSNFPNVVDPNFRDLIVGELGDPEWAVNFTAGFRTDKWQFKYDLRYLDKMSFGAIETVKSVQGRPPTDPDVAEISFYPSVYYHDLRIGYNATEELNVYAGVENIANKQPPFDLTGVGAGSGIYDNRGRFFYAGARYKF